MNCRNKYIGCRNQQFQEKEEKQFGGFEESKVQVSISPTF